MSEMSDLFQAVIAAAVGLMSAALFSTVAWRMRHSFAKIPRTTKGILTVQACAMLAIALFVALSVTLVGNRPDLAFGVLLCGVSVTELAFVLALFRAGRVEVTRERLRYETQARRQAIASGEISDLVGPLAGLMRILQAIWKRLLFGSSR
jgi:hypothetical protein